ncbi:MAG TPA: SDR family oxidoreductase [Gemmatimonadales bacterium]|nr:SDR family oxidoreductase [Gemmatimonadales bacterium]
MDLHGRVALVTGAGKRLGRAIAVGLGEAGCDVAVHYHGSADGAEDTARSIQETGRQARVFQADLRDGAAARGLADQVAGAFGHLDVVVNSAAVMVQREFASITAAEWNDALSLNLSAAFFVSQGAAPHLRKTRGKIVNLADLAAFEVWPSYLPLNVSKAGVVMLTHGLARILAPEITVNAVAPGAVLPPDDWPAAARERLAATTPLRRLGAPEDVVRAVLFLLESDYVTGVVLPVDGGRLVR